MVPRQIHFHYATAGAPVVLSYYLIKTCRIWNDVLFFILDNDPFCLLSFSRSALLEIYQCYIFAKNQILIVLIFL